MKRFLGVYVLVLAVVIWWAMQTPTLEPRDRQSPEEAAPELDSESAPPVPTPEPVADVDSDLTPRPDPDAKEPNDHPESPLQRRLRLGTKLQEAWEAGGDWKLALRAVMSHAIQLDGWYSRPYLTYRNRTNRSGWKAVRLYFMEPPRDTKSFCRVAPLRDGGLLHVWAPNRDVSRDEAQRYHDIVELWFKRLAPPKSYPIDLVFLPKLGRDTYPGASFPPWAAGVFTSDRIAFVDSGFRGANRIEVAQHELAHAMCDRLGISRTHRFVTEGVASYLQYSLPIDRSLEFPARRMRRALTWVRFMLEAMERRELLAGSTIRDEVYVGPIEFYARPWFYYPLALAAHAMVGGEVIESSLRAGDTRALREALGELTWKELLEFVKREGNELRFERPIFVNDAPKQRIPAAEDKKARKFAEVLSKPLKGESARRMFERWIGGRKTRVSLWVDRLGRSTRNDKSLLESIRERIDARQVLVESEQQLARLEVEHNEQMAEDRPDVLVLFLHAHGISVQNERTLAFRVARARAIKDDDKARWPRRIVIFGGKDRECTAYWTRVLTPATWNGTEIAVIERPTERR